MMQGRKIILGAALVGAVAALGVGQAVLQASAEMQGSQQVQAPMFEVDPLWPKPLPNNWVMGNVIGVGVDSRDHVFIVHRQQSVRDLPSESGAATSPPVSECCAPAPPVLEFDPEGNLVRSWGGEGAGYTWPESNHGITIDHNDNVWIGGNGAGDSHILKFTRDGRFIREMGRPGQPINSLDTTHFGRVAKVAIDPSANEAYVADGYGNRRVAVIDMETGRIKRFWGAYGNVPSDTALAPYNPDAPLINQFRTPVHCAEPSTDGLIYVCDRVNNRIQVFRKNGTFVKEQRVAPRTFGDGAVWDIAFSRDPQQRYLYLADGKNHKVYVMDRESLEILTTFGDGGRQPGAFFAVHSIATDSKGNIFTTETYEGRRIQRFVYKGLGPVTKKDQGIVWPARRGGGE
jgi:DNA-binding beta-propeller fold protein YncE